MFPRIMCLRRNVVLLLLLLFIMQIMLVVWYFSGEKYPKKSVLSRLEDSSTGAGTAGLGPGILHLSDDPNLDVFSWYGAEVCIKEGSDAGRSSADSCVCKAGWSGKRCGLPLHVVSLPWMTDPTLVSGLQVRKRPRRILLFITNFFHDYYILERNFRVLADIIDIFIVSEDESDYRIKNESLVARFRQGFLKRYHDKIVYVNVSFGVDSYPIDKLHDTVDTGFRLLSDVRTDDMLLFSTAEQIFNRDFVIFLKLFHNYPQPVLCDVDRYLHGFYWKIKPHDNHQHPEIPINARQDSGQVNKINKNKYHLIRRGRSADNVTESIDGKKEKKVAEDIEVVAPLETTTQGFNNFYLYKQYASQLHLTTVDPSQLPSICAISVHIFANVFENKVLRLHEEELLLKPRHLTFFQSLEQPIFPWMFVGAAWSCHLCEPARNLHRKLSALPLQKRPDWFDDSPSKYSSMIAFIMKLKADGKDEFLREAQANEFSLSDGLSSTQLPNSVLGNLNSFAALLNRS